MSYPAHPEIQLERIPKPFRDRQAPQSVSFASAVRRAYREYWSAASTRPGGLVGPL